MKHAANIKSELGSNFKLRDLRLGGLKFVDALPLIISATLILMALIYRGEKVIEEHKKDPTNAFLIQ